MSTTHVRALRDMRGAMAYTELGRGAKRRENIEQDTDRIAAHMGDFDMREDFDAYCEAMARQGRGRKVQGYEVRVSFDPSELDPGKDDDVQRAAEYGYLLCKRLAPNSPCDVDVHVDGEGGCVHCHAHLANHDDLTGRALYHGMTHRRVALLNDELAREQGLQVVGEAKDSFADNLRRAVSAALAASASMDEFEDELRIRGVDLRETRRRDKATGEERVGWTYAAMDYSGGKSRRRRRAASRLGEAYMAEAVQERFEPQPQPQPAPRAVQPAEGDDESAQNIWQEVEAFALTPQDARDGLNDLKEARTRKVRTNGASIRNDPMRTMIVKAQGDSEMFAEAFQAEVDAARERFRQAKDFEERVKRARTASGCVSDVLGFVGTQARNPVIRLFARYLAQLAGMRDREQRARRLADAKGQTYDARGLMWNAEKRAKAAGVAIEQFEASRSNDPRMRALYDKAEELELTKRREHRRAKDWELSL